MFKFCKKILPILAIWNYNYSAWAQPIQCQLPLINKILEKTHPSVGDILFNDPPTSPTKVPQVFLISDKKNPSETLGVLKIFSTPFDYEQELKSINYWKQFDFHHYGRSVKILSTDSNLIFMEHAGREDVEARIMNLRFRDDLSDDEKKAFLISSAQVLGRFLAEIHQIKKSTIDSEAEDKIIRPFIDYETDKLMSFVTGAPTQNRLKLELQVRDEKIEKLNTFFSESLNAYRKEGAKTRALYHGDAHPGNFSILANDYVVTFDLQSSLWSLDPTESFSIADPMADLGKMSMGFLITGMNAHLPMEWLSNAQNALKAAYFAHESERYTPEKTLEDLWLSQKAAIQFYENRMTALVLASKKKMTDDTRRKLIDYLIQ